MVMAVGLTVDFFILAPDVLDLIEDDDSVWEREPMQALAAKGELQAYFHRGFWQPMDTLRDKRELEQWGSERIRGALIERGVDSETVAAVLDAGPTELGGGSEGERERALALLRRRFPDPPHRHGN